LPARMLGVKYRLSPVLHKLVVAGTRARNSAAVLTSTTKMVRQSLEKEAA
jgi:hypothetical protein